MITVSNDPALSALRLELSALIDYKWSEQVNMVERMRTAYPHSIRPMKVDPFFLDRIGQFNCFAYAFQVARWDGFFELSAPPSIRQNGVAHETCPRSARPVRHDRRRPRKAPRLHRRV